MALTRVIRWVKNLVPCVHPSFWSLFDMPMPLEFRYFQQGQIANEDTGVLRASLLLFDCVCISNCRHEWDHHIHDVNLWKHVLRAQCHKWSLTPLCDETDSGTLALKMESKALSNFVKNPTILPSKIARAFHSLEVEKRNRKVHIEHEIVRVHWHASLPLWMSPSCRSFH